ncbi:MAG: C-terminal helicase domain-containing protein, partial [Bacteroidota bacterium]
SAYMLHEDQKIPMIEHILATQEVESMIIFASSKLNVDRITRSLKKLKYPVKAIHSDKDQEERQQSLREFKNRQFNILVGTDVLARGIDIDNLSHVLNYDCPHDAEDYVHRVGRTARASSTGSAITFITQKDAYRMAQIEELIEAEVPKPTPPEQIGETPVYRPRRGRGGGGGGRGRGRGGRGRHQGGGRGRNGGGNRNYRGGGGKKRSAKPSNRNQSREQGQKPQDGQASNKGPEASNDKPKKSRNRNRNRNRKPKNQGGANKAVDQPRQE